MKGLWLAAALAWAPAASAASAKHVSCPDGSAPVFTGHPFKPISCPKKARAQALDGISLLPSALPDPDIKDSERSSLAPLLGHWQGLIYFAGGRYEVTLDLAGAGRKHQLTFTSMDYHTHIKYDYKGELKSGLWSKGPMSFTLALEELPVAPLSGKAWLGAAPMDEGRRPALDRQASVIFTGRPEQHVLQFTLDGPNRLRFIYSHLDLARATVRTTGELTRADAKP